MTTRTTLMIAAAVLALSVPAFAQEDMQQAAKDAAMKNATDNQTAFSQGIKSIKNWFGSDQPEDIEPATGTMMTDGDDIAVPPQPGVNAIEPAAGLDEDNLQTPPRYMGEQSAVDPNAMPRATSFDDNPSVAAFGDAQDDIKMVTNEQSVAELAAIQAAAGEGTALDTSKIDCAAILKAADEAREGDVPDTAMIEACETETPVDATMPAAQPTEPAQPGFEPSASPLPATQPAAGEPPIGGAVMPGGKPEEQPSQPVN